MTDRGPPSPPEGSVYIIDLTEQEIEEYRRLRPMPPLHPRLLVSADLLAQIRQNLAETKNE